MKSGPQDFCFYGYALYCPPTTLGNQDYHEHTQAGLTFRPIKPLKIENSYLFERLRTTTTSIFSNSPSFPVPAAAFSTPTSCGAGGTAGSLRSFRYG